MAGYLCLRPFSRFEILKNGRCIACCRTINLKGYGDIKNKSFEEVWNGKEAQELRRSILDGSYRYCDPQLCHFISTNTPEKLMHDVDYRKVLGAVKKGLTVLPFGPVEFVATYERTCNLSCDFCRDGVISPEDQDKEAVNKIHNKVINEVLKDTQRVTLSGAGEPLCSPLLLEWLRNFDEKKHPQLKSIHLATNGLLFTPEMWEFIKKVHHLIQYIEVGVDAATPATYSKIRKGGEFNKLKRNLDFISRLGIRTVLVFVVQRDNYKEMAAFVKMFQPKFTLKFSLLMNKGTFTDAKYAERAVHLKSNLEHKNFLEVIRDPIFQRENVHLQNVGQFL